MMITWLGGLLRRRTGRLAAISFAASTATFNATYQQQAEADAQLSTAVEELRDL